MGLFNKKKMNTEEEIEFLYDNDMERIKRWKGAKINKIFCDCLSWFTLLMFIYLIYMFFNLMDTSDGNVLESPISLFLLVLIITFPAGRNYSSQYENELKFLSTISVLKKKIKTEPKDKADSEPPPQ